MRADSLVTMSHAAGAGMGIAALPCYLGDSLPVFLHRHCQCRSRGMVIEGDKGPMISPYIAIADKALTHCQKLWIELGLTPSGRSRLHALPDAEPKQNKWANLL